VMFGGQIAQVDTPEAVYDRPASAAVARFVGQANVVDGVVAGTNGDRRIESPLGRLPMPPRLGLTPGTFVSVIARPQAIALTPVASGTPLAGTVAARYFHGAFIDYRIAVGEQVLNVQAAPPALHEPGDAVALGFDPARLWAVEAA